MAGVLLFGIFLVLLVQDRAARKSIFAAALAFAWNLTSLIVLSTDAPDSLASRWTVALGFAVLSLLPAVLFDLCLGASGGGLVRAGYALSIVTMIPHVAEVFQPNTNLHREAITAIAVGFGILTAIAAFRESGTTRLVGTMSLFLLAVSFVHLGDGHAEQIWSQELAFHHAAIPLALLVLMQDYRFLLVDAFLRFLANAILAALFVSAGAFAWRAGWLPSPQTPFQLSVLLIIACLILILFAMARSQLQRILTRVLFRRPDEATLLSALRAPVRSEDDYLNVAARVLGNYTQAEVWLCPRPNPVAQTHISVRTSTEATRFIAFGRRSGGRRYLSEDLAVLDRAGAVIVEQLDAHHETEMRRLVSQAELRALQSQIHPHFLFNALNALYGIIPREARGARDTVLNLADIFRYFLDTRKTQVPLSEEMRIVAAYLDIERLRLGDKLRTEIDVAPDALDIAIPVLSIQPIVENAVKHGVAPLSSGGVVAIEVRRDGDGLHVSVSDTGRGFQNNGHPGVGLENVRKRLQLSYGGAAQLDIYSGPQGSTVSMLIPVSAAHAVEVMQ